MSENRDLMSDQAAGHLADSFLGLFNLSQSLFATNGAQYSYGYAYSPITQHTSDAGVIVVDPEHVGMLWFADED